MITDGSEYFGGTVRVTSLPHGKEVVDPLPRGRFRSGQRAPSIRLELGPLDRTHAGTLNLFRCRLGQIEDARANPGSPVGDRHHRIQTGPHVDDPNFRPQWQGAGSRRELETIK